MAEKPPRTEHTEDWQERLRCDPTNPSRNRSLLGWTDPGPTVFPFLTEAFAVPVHLLFNDS
jgi:hypothetical protein